MLDYIGVKSRDRNEFIDITGNVEESVRKSGVKTGVCLVYTPHTTAAITVNEGADPSVKSDVLSTLSKLVPRDAGYCHAEGNSDSHVKSSLVGASEHFIIEKGKLVLGTWQSVYFCEFDGPRSRRVAIKVLQD